jgi:PAS domain S-box-containing protein
LLREAGKLAKLGGWEIDLATNKLTWTEETYNIHEVPTGNSPQLEDGIRFYAPEAQPILNKAIDRAINHGEPFDLELPFITAKGNHLWVRSIGNVECMNGIASRLYGVFQDITERKQTEKALRENEEKYRTLVENSLVGVVQTNLKGDVLYVNDSFVKMYEATSAEEFIGAQMTGVYKYEHDRNEVLSLLKKDGRVDNFEVVGLTVKGNEKTRLLSAKVSGEVINGLVFDITERKIAEQSLQHSEEKYRLILENSGIGVGVYSTDGKIQLFNKKALENLGGKSEDYVGKTLAEVFGPEAAAIYSERFKKAARSETSLEFEDFVQLPSGEHCFLSNYSKITNAKGEIIGIQVLSHNISERKQAEAAVKASEEKFRSLYIHMAEGAALHNLIYNDHGIPEDYLIVEVNPAYEVQLGITRETVINKTSKEAYGVAVPPFFDIYSRVALTGKPEIFETYFAPLDKYFSISVYHPYPGSFATVFDNITERKHAEAEIKLKNLQLEKLNSEKDKFFSIIAHDLRGPFNGFLGLTQIMAEQYKTLTLTQLQEISMGLNKSAKNLFSLLNNLLEWSRMQQGTINFEPKAIPILPFATSTLQTIIDPATKKGIEVTIDIPENLQVFADENMLASTIRNIASNAVKFTSTGGKVSITAKPTIGNKIEISVKDTGIGMDAEMLGNMFKLDVSISRKGTDGEPSTGLGLLLCKDFIEKHGGRIWAESEEGKGSTFYFTLPSKA